MYKVKTTAHFDAAHFLAGYSGKCANIHGHRWRVEVTIQSETLADGGQLDGMVVDFGDIKRDLRAIAERFDHTLIYQKGTLRAKTEQALSEENFKLTPVDFRPTAENFAKYFYDEIKKLGYNAASAAVYETPGNCAEYGEGQI